MKKILLTASTAVLLCGCGGPNYSITGNAGLEPGDSVFLIGSGRTELAAGVVCADSTIRLQGRVAEPEIARLAHQERIPVGTAVIFLEPGDIRTVPTDDRRVYAVSGTPLNDKKREFDERMADFDRKFRELPPDAPADSLYAAYTKLVPESIGANSDNLFGAYLFSVYEFDGNDIAAAKARLECFTPAMQAHPTLKRIAEKVAAAENNDAAKWKTFVADNDMPWINVLGVSADKRSDAAAMYGISSIPANFLISPEGIIVARDLRGENIKARLEEAMR